MPNIGPSSREFNYFDQYHDALRTDIPCAVCGARQAEAVFAEPPFQIVRCAVCSLVYTRPRLPAAVIENMYQEMYWRSPSPKDFGYENYLGDRERQLKTYRMRTRVIDRHVSAPGKVLDVGCAAGSFLKVMADKGWQPAGVELSAHMARQAREMFGFSEIYAGNLADQDLPPESFDLVSFWDVIEHLEEPAKALVEAHKLLKQDGLLVLETQNVASFFARLMGRRWQHYKYQEHFWHFSPHTIRMLLERTGFELIERTPRYGGKYISLHFIYERAGRVHPLFSRLLAPVFRDNQTSIYVNPRDEMIVVARKV